MRYNNDVYICKLSPSFKDQRVLHMLHDIMSEKEYCLFLRHRLSVSERMNIYFTCSPINLLSLVPKP